MCGIIGYVGKRPDIKKFEIARDTMIQRGPDDAGLYFDEKNGVILGHRRLSIIDLSSAGHQPMTTDDGNLIIVFNGEIYNYLEIKEELKDKYRFISETDTEVLLAAYKEWGVECLKKFNGMFAFIIYDKAKNFLFGARDRVGKKPFYYHLRDGEFVFASELKALLAMGIMAAPNDKIIYDYLARGWYEHTDETFFAGINKLPAGHYLIFENNRLTIKRYWDITTLKKRASPDFEEVKAEFLTLLRDAVRLRLRSDVPVGVGISGGLDSSCLMSLVQEQGKAERIKAFTYHFCNSNFDESPYMRALVEKYSSDWHQSFLKAEEVPALAEEVMSFQDEPYSGIPTIANYKMYRLAKSLGVTVLLEGHGVDELLAGYKYYFTPFYRDLLRDLQFLRVKEEIWQIAKEENISLLAAAINFFKCVSERAVVNRHFDYTKPIRPECLRRDFVKKFGGDEAGFPRPFGGSLDNALYKDMFFARMPRVLRFKDHLSMAASVELRSPYLDYRLMEFCYSLSNDFRIKKGQGKYLMRKAMTGRSLAENRTAKKRSVVAPQIEWFQGPLANWVKSIVLSESFLSRPYFNPDMIRAELNRFLTVPADNSFFIWQWISLEMWFRKYID